METQVLVSWSDGKPQYKTGTLVNPAYSRSGFDVYKIEDRFFVGAGAGVAVQWFETLSAAWSHCESLYYSYN